MADDLKMADDSKMADEIDTNPSAELTSQLRDLEEELQMKDELLHKAGELGKNLLEENAELHEQMELRDRDFIHKLETKEQELHALHKSMEQKSKMERVYLDEMECLKSSLESMKQQHEFQNEAEQCSKLFDMKKKNETLQMEVDRLLLAESQLQNELETLNNQMVTLRQELTNHESRSNETCSEDMTRLLVEVQTEREEKEGLKKSLHSSNNENQQLHLTVRHLKQEVTSSKEEVEEKECQITSYQNALEKCREECQDLQVQLDVQRMETMDKANKGNSLFSEVEDRRVQAELELSKLRVHYDSIKKKHTMVAQQMHRYQSQMLLFMQSAASQVDESRLRKLERDAYVARQQIEQLTRENNELRKRKDDDLNIRGTLSAMETISRTEFNDFMLVRLENKSKELETMRKELSSEKFKRMSFENSLMEKESELYKTKKRMKSTEAANAKVKLEIEKMKLKYEPESLNVGDKLERRHVETIPLFEITDKLPDQTQRAERRNAVSESCEKNKELDLVEILSKPRSAKRVKITENAVAMVTAPDVAIETETVGNEESLVGENPNPEDKKDKKKKFKGREQYRRTVEVTGENSEQCKQQ